MYSRQGPRSIDLNRPKKTDIEEQRMRGWSAIEQGALVFSADSCSERGFAFLRSVALRGVTESPQLPDVLLTASKL